VTGLPPRPIRRLLIANRGEIARRVIRTARRLGVETVAVFSDADRHAPFVREADQAMRLGPAPARESYLDAAKVLAAAKASGADAIHPGYGFLSENAEFAEAVAGAGLTWVGPPAAAIRSMGLKDAAKALMAKAGVPVTPGYLGQEQAAARLADEAAKIGYPVLIKAVAGGGGKGMRLAESKDDFAEALAGARREAAAAFGDDRVLLETYVRRPRHIEVQIFADQFGEVVHLFERDCSLQRRRQKVIEEAPAPGMNAAVRRAVTGAAIEAARAVGYVGAGTVEFIADASEGLRADRIWFMEMNTRLQVEHPVTEMITGLDLVEWQLRIAAGEPLPLKQDEIRAEGWAMEARLYAESPSGGFLPSTGTMEHFELPTADGFLRIDSGVERGGEITADYDPMIAKLVAHAPTRAGAAGRLAEACRQVEIWPVKCNAGFLARCLGESDFIAGKIDTGFIETRLPALAADPEPSPAVVATAAASFIALDDVGDEPSPWSSSAGAAAFRLNAPAKLDVRVAYGEAILGASLLDADADLSARQLATPEGRLVIFADGQAFVFDRAASAFHGGADTVAVDGRIIAPMPGRIVSVGGKVGASVKAGQGVVVLEAMKMEHTLTAPFDGTLAQRAVAAGDQVSEGQVLAVVERTKA